jgi:hypothetical protein
MGLGPEALLMAALDFPASPINGQVFNAPNGVTYVYDSTRGMWLTSATVAPLAADFIATHNVNFALPSSAWTVLLLNTVLTGNAGGWYNTGTGRFTPPAGRYKLIAMLSGTQSGGTYLGLNIYKNGAAIPNLTGASANAGAGQWADLAVETHVDANGTDYFTAVGYAGSSTSSTWATFSAIPVAIPTITPVMPNTLQLYSEQVLSSPAAEMRATWPSGARYVELQFNYSGLVNNAVNMRGMLNGVPDATASYNLAQTATFAPNTLAATVSAGVTSFPFGGTVNSGWGKLTLVMPGIMRGIANWYATDNGGTAYNFQSSFHAPTLSGLNGAQMFPGAGNFATGSFLRAFVVP